jgi:hypothetical protein
MSESSIQKQIRLAVSQGGAIVFRNNVGVLPDRFGTPVHYGLCKGSSDLIGWRSVVVTPDMVGKRLALFLALEVKSATGAIRPEQKIFIENVRKAGGLAGVVRSVDEALGVCSPLL